MGAAARIEVHVLVDTRRVAQLAPRQCDHVALDHVDVSVACYHLAPATDGDDTVAPPPPPLLAWTARCNALTRLAPPHNRPRVELNAVLRAFGLVRRYETMACDVRCCVNSEYVARNGTRARLAHWHRRGFRTFPHPNRNATSHEQRREHEPVVPRAIANRDLWTRVYDAVVAMNAEFALLDASSDEDSTRDDGDAAVPPPSLARAREFFS